MTEGILFSQMIPRDEDIDRFNTWYNSDHIPARMAISHFVRATRYAPADEVTSDYLAVYEVDDLSAFDSKEYQDLKKRPSGETEIMLSRVTGFTRYIAELIDDTGEIDNPGAYLSVVAFTVPEDDEKEFNAWYAGEHIPLLMKAESWLRVRRYKVKDGQGGPWTHLALHEIADLDVLDSPERAVARQGPLRDTLVDRSWFGQSGRWIYECVHRAEAVDYRNLTA